MALLQVLIAPHPILSTKAKLVEKIDERIKQLLNDMVETMYHEDGIGLAAPQIGVSERAIVIDIGDDESTLYKMVNPEITWVSDHDNKGPEGCLSVPEHYADVIRPAEVEIKYLNENSEEKTLKADGLLAICIQHEIDHLNGILFIDHLSQLRRNMILRKLLKDKKPKF